jgi:hypothetical protein
MRRNPVLLAVSALLFAGWLTWLGVQALKHAQPVVVSRAQLLSAKYLVVAKVGEGGSVHVNEVWRSPERPALRPGDTPKVADLETAVGYQGPGEYLLPLAAGANDQYAVPLPPVSPGYNKPLPEHRRIYPWTPEVQRQLESMGLSAPDGAAR